MWTPHEKPRYVAESMVVSIISKTSYKPVIGGQAVNGNV